MLSRVQRVLTGLSILVCGCCQLNYDQIHQDAKGLSLIQPRDEGTDCYFDVEIKVLTDLFPFETEWLIQDVPTGEYVAQVFGMMLPPKRLIKFRECLPLSCYRFSILDYAGDGIFFGFFELKVNGVIEARSIFRGYNETAFFGCESPCATDEMFVMFTALNANNFEKREIKTEMHIELEDTTTQGLITSKQMIGQGGTYEFVGYCLPQRCHRLTVSDDPASKRDYYIAIDYEMDVYGIVTGMETTFIIGAKSNETTLLLELQTDYWSEDITWEVVNNDTGNIEFSSQRRYESYERYRYAFCLPTSECNFLFKITDSFGDGIFPPGFVRLTENGKIIVHESLFGSSKIAYIGCDRITMPPTQNPSIQADCDEDEISFVLVIMTDNWGMETSWELKDVKNDEIVHSSNDRYDDSASIQVGQCLPRRCYQFTIFDLNRDGIVDGGGYKLLVDGKIVADGNDFDYKETTVFGCTCANNQIPAYVEIYTGQYVQGTSFEVSELSKGSRVLEKHQFESDTSYHFDFCITNATSCYQLILRDSYGLGEHSYELVVGNDIKAQGNDFGFEYKEIFGCPSSSIAPEYFDELRFNPNTKSSPLLQGTGKNMQKIEIPYTDTVSTSNGQVFLCHVPIFTTSVKSSLEEEALEVIYHTIAGALMAIHHWNNLNGIVAPSVATDSNKRCPLRFTTEVSDSISPSLDTDNNAIKDLVAMMSRRNDDLKRPQPCAALQSTPSTHFAAVASAHDMFLVSNTDQSTIVDVDDDLLLSRTNPTHKEIVLQTMRYLKIVAGAKYFCFIYSDDDESWNALRETILDESKALGLVVLLLPLSSQATSEQTDKAFQKLQDANLNFVVSTVSLNWTEVMQVAIEYRCFGIENQKFWIFLDPLKHLESIELTRADAQVIKASIGNAVLSYIGRFDPYREESDIFKREWRKMRDDDNNLVNYFTSKLPERLNYAESIQKLLSREPSNEARYSYDAIISLGLSACSHSSKTHSSLFDSNFSGKSWYQELKNIDFMGASGLISYEDSKSSRDANGSQFLLSIFRETVDDVGSHNLFMFEPHHYFDIPSKSWKDANPSATDLRNKLQSLATIENLSTEYVIIHDEGLIEEDMNLVRSGVRWTCVGMSIVSSLTSCFSFCYIIANSDRREIRVSQPPFLIICCIGTLLMSLSVIPKSMDDSLIGNSLMLNMSCVSPWWLWFIGFVITFSALFSKLWRLNKILQASISFIRVKVTVLDVMIPFIILFTLNALVLSIWHGLSAPTYKRIPTFDLVGRRVASIGMCSYNKVDWIPITILLVLAFSALVTANYYAYQTRQTKYSESKHIAIATVCIFQALAVAVPCLAIYKKNLNADLFTWTFATFCICESTMLSLMLPKVLERYQRKDTTSETNIYGSPVYDLRSSSSSDCGGTDTLTHGSSFTSRFSTGSLEPKRSNNATSFSSDVQGHISVKQCEPRSYYED